MMRIGLALVIAMTIMAETQPELKRVMTTAPDNGGTLRMTAISIDRQWNPPVTHLKGRVLVEILSQHNPAHQVTMVHADEADYFEETGELVPEGHVRITLGTTH